MKKKIYLLMMALSFCFFNLGTILAQNESINFKDSLSTNVDSDFDYKFDFGNTEFEDFNLFRFLSGDDQPFLTFDFGLTEASIYKDYFGDKFTKNKFLEGKIGYSDTKLHSNGRILKYNDEYLRFAYSSEKLFTNDVANDRIASKRWVISYGISKGYGWSLGSDADLVLYNSDLANWTRVDFSDSATVPNTQHRLDRFSDDLRFGRSFEAGFRLRFFDNISLTAGYEQEQIFARYQIWYWAGSEIIEAAVTGLTSDFISRVIKRSSTAGPIVNFIIKNGISYAFYELRKKDMNWPIKTEAPLVFDNFKIGISFTF
jgi:hypothetical protein